MIKINDNSPVPIYQQIVNAIHHAILAGIYKPDHRLPSIRDLAVEIKVNPNTIAKAYQEMASEDIIYFKRGQGAYVSPRSTKELHEEAKVEIIKRIKEIISVAQSMGMSNTQVKELFIQVLDESDQKPAKEAK
jgi:GntR family transcriptional regulator